MIQKQAQKCADKENGKIPPSTSKSDKNLKYTTMLTDISAYWPRNNLRHDFS